MLILSLLACTPGADTATAHTGDTARVDDTADTADTGPEITGIVPPPWMTEASVFTVPMGRGRTQFVLDEGFRIEDFAVPQVFVAPDGQFGMMATDMRMTDTFVKRSVFYSADGTEWADATVLIAPDAWSEGCGTRLEDGAVWHRGEGLWLYIFEGTEAAEGGSSQGKRHFCQARTTDGVAFETVAEPLYSGSYEGDIVSVPAILPLEDGDGRLFFNGDLLVNPGIRIANVDVDTLITDVVAPDPILDARDVDPNPVYRSEGGFGLFHTWADPEDDNHTGLGWTFLDADGTAVEGADVALLDSPGTCGKLGTGTCYMDPTYAALPDGRLVLYFTVLTTAEDGSFTVAIGRAFSGD